MGYTIKLPDEAATESGGRYTIKLPDDKGSAKDTTGLGYAADAAMGARQAWDAAAQMLARGVESVVPAVKGSRERLERDSKQNFDNYKSLTQADARSGSDLVRGLGQMAISLPVTPTIKAGGLIKTLASGGAIGAEGGALTPVYDTQNGADFLSQKMDQVLGGAAVGAGTGLVGSVAGKVLDPAIGAAQRGLQAAGVRMTPGQAMGGIAKSVEDKLSSFPLLGDLINSRRFAGVSDFNRAVYAKAVEPFGAEGAAIVKNSEPGNAGIKRVGDFLSSKYEEALSKSAPSVVDNSFKSGIANVASMVPESLRGDFVSAMQRTIVGKITPGGTLTPSVAKAAESELGRLASNYKGSADAAQREMGMALMQAQSELRDLVARNNPKIAPLIQAANQGWRTLVQMENAGAMLGAKGGIFTPAQFLNAVKKSDKSVRDRAFARGDAYNQEFAQAADKVLPNKVPNSGTADRALLGLVAGGGADFVVPGSGAALGAASAAYLPGVNELLTNILAGQRPQVVRTLADLTRKVTPYASLYGGAVSGE